MARRFTCGFETPFFTSSSSEIDATRLESGTYLTPGRCGGYAFTLDHGVAGINYSYEHDIRDIDGGSAGSAIEPSYSRFYLRVRQYPAAGGSPVGTTFWGVTGSADLLEPGSVAIPSLYGVLLSDGTVNFYSEGLDTVATNLLGTITSPLLLNVWYRFNIYLQFNTDAGVGISNASFTVQVTPDGESIPALPSPAGQTASLGTRSLYFGGTTTAEAWSGGINRETNDGTWFFVGNSNRLSGMNGGTIDIDDWVIDDTVAPSDGFITLHRPVAAGTYSEWTTNGFRSVRALPEDADTDLASSGVSARVSFQVESLASKGVTGTIKSVRVAGRVNAPRDSWTFGLRQNGVDHYNPAVVTGTNAPIGWIVDSGVLAVLPSDTLEIIVRDGTGAGTNAVMDFVGLVVDQEVSTFDPFATAGTDIQVYEGTFVGTGALQDISVPFATSAELDFIVVRPDNAGGTGGWWTRGMGDRGDHSLAIADGSTDSPIAWVDSNSFTVRAAAGVNDLGETNRFVAVADPSRRLSIPSGHISFNTAGQEDGRTVYLADTTFIPEAGFFANWIAGTNAMFYRGPGHVGDLSSRIDTDVAAAADQIQSFVTGGYTAGIAVQFAQSPYKNQLFRTTGVFVVNTLCAIGSYTGDNVASRVIPVTLTGATGPGFVLVVPHNTGIRCCRFGSQTGSGSFRWNAATLNTTTGITAFDLTGFTVTTGSVNLNASGVIYDYLVFGVGADPASVPVPDTPLVIVEPQPSIELCEDCGCRMVYVPREDRLFRVDRQIRATEVPIDPRTEVVPLNRRVTAVLLENRELDIDCA